MIVIAGGSGLLGRNVAALLSGAGEPIRVLVRDAARAQAVLGHEIEVCTADVRRPDEVGPLLADASVVVSAVHGFLGGRGAGPAEVDRDGNRHLVEAAHANGADVVLMSVLPASLDSPVDLFRAKARAEQQLRASGASWTIVRSAPFLETWLDVLTQTAGRTGRPSIFGTGQQPIGFVPVADVAALVALAATDRSLRGRTLEISGAPMTMNELAAALQEARGWTGRPRHIPRAMLRLLGSVTRPVSPAFARKSRTALYLDTHADQPADDANTPQLPRHTLAEVLNAPVR